MSSGNIYIASGSNDDVNRPKIGTYSDLLQVQYLAVRKTPIIRLTNTFSNNSVTISAGPFVKIVPDTVGNIAFTCKIIRSIHHDPA